ncbi:MAG: hypothetical protein N2663_06135 [Chlorobi bacterium]|nr:hypothetical protein [Chlorobiota bacterium]
MESNRWRLWTGTLVVSSLLVAIISGAVLSLFYQPSSLTGNRHLYRAATSILDSSGDTLFRKGEIVWLDVLPPHNGKLIPIGDSSIPSSAALVSHEAMLDHHEGVMMVSVHRVAASVLIASLAAFAASAVIRGYRWYSRDGFVLLILIAAMATAWIGTTLPADSRGLDAYAVGRAFLVDNLPIAGDVIAAILPIKHNAARLFSLHAVWLAPILAIATVFVLSPRTLQVESLTVGIGALAIVVTGWGAMLLGGHEMSGAVSMPVWHLTVVYLLLQALPMDVTMAIVLMWWCSVFIAGTSHVRWVRRAGAILIVSWFIAGALIAQFKAL